MLKISLWSAVKCRKYNHLLKNPCYCYFISIYNLLTVDSKRSFCLVSSKIVGSSAFINSSILKCRINDGKGWTILSDFYLNFARILEDFTLEVPCDLRFWISSKSCLKSCSLSLFQSHLLNFSDKLWSLFSFCNRIENYFSTLTL